MQRNHRTVEARFEQAEPKRAESELSGSEQVVPKWAGSEWS